MSILFPHPEVRPVQQQLIQDIADALEKKQNLLAHAPTGLGKTASVLSVTIPYALEHGLTVFFLTNRHTQHKIAVETLALMKQKHDVDFTVADLIGKKWMCLQEGVEHMYQSDFAEFCKAMREHNTCNFYQKLYRSAQLSPDAQRAQHELAKKTSSADEVKSVCAAHGICPYYFASELAKDADVIIADYYNLFHPEVQQSFFSRIGKKLEESIIIVDEAHNLPERIRAVMSRKLSGTTIKYALSEAKKFSPDIIHSLQSVHHALHELSVHAPKVVRTEQFVSAIKDYASVADKCVVIGDAVRETEKRSFIGSIGEFLESWSGSDDGYVRYIETFNKEPYVTLHLSCLDAAMVSAPIFHNAYASILMSGTLTPLSLFRDVLDVPRSVERIYPSPFPQQHRHVLVVPETTTKFALRNSAMYDEIATVCKRIIASVRGKCAMFFPSYEICSQVTSRFDGIKLFAERSGMTTDEKKHLLQSFVEHDTGVLCGVAAASFAEGIDLPGVLKAVIIVGLPLARPDIRTNALIQYYDKKFHAGWDYGYTLPAMIKCLQAAGRCIRSERDKGVIVFLDKRYIQPRYYQCIPPDWQAEVTRNYVEKIEMFYSTNSK